MTNTTFHFDSVKYVLVRDDRTYQLEAYRHGEPWSRDFVGDNLIHAMLNEIERLREYEYMYKEIQNQVFDIHSLQGVNTDVRC